MDGSEGLCRGCLGQFNVQLELLQYTERNRRLFIYCTGIQVKRNDAFTFQLCKECYLNMKAACKFKKQCRASNRKFESYQNLKEDDNMLDFNTFLQNYESSMSFRLDPINGHSTPVYQRARDEDNESTCTSIRNFITDILKSDLPDTEEGIIQEVIEEERDVLDDSLDSHWLQDDILIDPELSLDFSLNAFGTPQSLSNDHDQIPQIQINETINKHVLQNSSNIHKYLEKDFNKAGTEQIQNNSEELLENQDQNVLHKDIANEDLENQENTLIPLNLFTSKHVLQSADTVMQIDHGNIEKTEHTILKNINCDNSGDIVNFPLESSRCVKSQCTIDRNLEKALRNKENDRFLLDELLVSPQVPSDLSGASTPTISNILFGDKLDTEVVNRDFEQKIGEDLENIDKIPDLEEFFQKDPGKQVKYEQYDMEQGRNNTGALNEDYVNCETVSLNGSGIIDEFLRSAKHEDDEDPARCKVKSDMDAVSLNYEFFENIDNNDKEMPKATKDNQQYCITNFYCKMCNKKFASLKALKIHFTRYHKVPILDKSDVKIRQCPECGLWITPGNLSRHIQRHRNIQIKVECDLCKMTFTSKSKLIVHMPTHYIKEKYKKAPVEKNFMCNFCGKMFVSAHNFNFHKRIHAKDYTEWCTQCGKGFCRISDLKEHMRKHTGAQPFPCAHCTKRFARRASLNKHMLKHIAGKLFECKYCYFRFITHQDLMNHLKRSTQCKKLREELGCTEDIINLDLNNMMVSSAEQIK